MRKAFVLFALCGAILVLAAPSYAEFTVRPGTISNVRLTMDESLLQRSNIHREWYRSIPTSIRMGYYYPKGYSIGDKVSLFVIFGPQGANLQSIDSYTKFADRLGLIIIAPQPVRSNHDDRPNYYYTLKAIQIFKKQGVLDEESRIIIGGFSGGSKMAMVVGVWGGSRFNGVLAIGCNVDLASHGYKWLKNPTAFTLPIVLLNATDDTMVKDATKGVLDSMGRTGFRELYTLSYTGGHHIPDAETMGALRFLLERS